MRGHMRELDLSFVFPSSVSYSDLTDLLDVIDGVDWSEVPIEQARRVTRRHDVSPGRTANSGDFIWYDPWNKLFATVVTARANTSLLRVYDEYLPTHFFFVEKAHVVNRIENSRFILVTVPVAGVSVVANFDARVEDPPLGEPALTAGVLELYIVFQFLMQAGIPSEGVSTMSEAVSVARVASRASLPSVTPLDLFKHDSPARASVVDGSEVNECLLLVSTYCLSCLIFVPLWNSF